MAELAADEERLFGDAPALVADALENAIGRPAERRMLPAQPGDTHATWADVSLLRDAVGYEPKVPVAEGVRRFVEWYREYHRI